jgi:hypothetical protein
MRIINGRDSAKQTSRVFPELRGPRHNFDHLILSGLPAEIAGSFSIRDPIVVSTRAKTLSSFGKALIGHGDEEIPQPVQARVLEEE